MASNSSKTNRKSCCLTSCSRKQDDLNGQGHVEVKAYSPPKLNHEYKVRWSGEGYANFHDDCWLALQSRQVPDMHAKEAAMIDEADKTAEYFESAADVERKAKNIAKLLKTAKHAIAFTGEL